MVYNLKKMFGKRSITFLLVLSIVSSTFYLPVFIPRTQAFLGFGDITFEVGSHIRSIIKAIAMSLAQRMIDDMVNSTIKWAQSGFEGNPAYVTDSKQYFADIADGVVGDFIYDSSRLNFLCSPFQTQIRLALQKSYAQLRPFQCTLTRVVGNIDAFYNDFSQGGWDGWFYMTQNDLNNPYGAFLEAKIELDSRIASAIGVEREQLDWNQGFLSWSECEDWELLGFNPDGSPINGKCEKRGPVQTPGSVIKSQLDEVMSSGLKKLISAQEMEQLISSFATGLLNRYVFGSRGLFADNSSGSNISGGSGNIAGTLDLDNDGVPDGQDSDQDGRLESSTDVCYHGRTPPRGTPPTSNCVNSSGVTTSPYFTPVCQAIDGAVASLTEYTKFIDSHADQVEGGGSLKGAIIGRVLGGPVGLVLGIFGLGGGSGADNFKVKADADIWANRTSEANSAVDEILSRIQSRHSSYFDDIEIATNRFSNYIGKVLESLIKDKDLDLARRGNGGGGLENLMKHSAYNLRYFMEVKTRIGKCENPNISGINDIPTPPPVEGGPGDGTPDPNCADKGQTDLYQSDVRNAANEYLALHPEIASLSSGDEPITSPGILAVTQLRDGVIAILQGQGFHAEKGASPQPYVGGEYFYPQIVYVWRTGDPDKTGYRVTAGGGTISAAIEVGYCGGHETFAGVDILPGGQPTSLLSDVEIERNKYPASFVGLCNTLGGLQPDSCPLGKILNTVAWNNRAAGWGLSSKTSGNRCPSPAGEIACDVLHHQSTNLMYDVLINSETEADPTWRLIGPNTNTGRPWVAPVQP